LISFLADIFIASLTMLVLLNFIRHFLEVPSLKMFSIHLYLETVSDPDFNK